MVTGKLGSIGKVLILSYVVTGILLLVCAFLLYKLKLTEPQIELMIIIIYAIASIIAGFVMGKIQKSRRLLWGFIMGLTYFVVLSIISFIANMGFYEDTKTAAIALSICIGGGCIGGILS